MHNFDFYTHDDDYAITSKKRERERDYAQPQIKKFTMSCTNFFSLCMLPI